MHPWTKSDVCASSYTVIQREILHDLVVVVQSLSRVLLCDLKVRPGAIAQSPGREAALCRASLPKPCPASSISAREGAGCGSVGAVSGA